jgi:hypothetical protein
VNSSVPRCRRIRRRQLHSQPLYAHAFSATLLKTLHFRFAQIGDIPGAGGERAKATRGRLSPLNADNRSDVQCGYSESRSKPRSGPQQKSKVELSSQTRFSHFEPNGEVL